VQFLDSEWISALNDAVATADVGDANIVIQQRVTFENGDSVEYYVQASGGSAAVIAGTHSSPEVALTQSLSTAIALRDGSLNALAAFQQGLIDVTGDVQALMAARPALEAIDAAAATLI
jgi:putative sterol carrier protein